MLDGFRAVPRAAVTLLVLPSLHRAEWALVYLVVFGVGTVLGMLCLTAAMARRR